MATRKQNRRAFKRDAFLGFRLPDSEKTRLETVARESRRDMSSLVLEWIIPHIGEAERRIAKDRLSIAGV